MEYFDAQEMWYVGYDDDYTLVVPMCPKTLNTPWDACKVCNYHEVHIAPDPECINCKWFTHNNIGENIPGVLGGIQLVTRKYNLHDWMDISAEHDKLYMGPPEYVEGKRQDTTLSNYTLEERRLMTAYGWSWNWEFECWDMNT